MHTTSTLNIVIEAFGKHSSNLAVSLYKQVQLAFYPTYPITPKHFHSPVLKTSERCTTDFSLLHKNCKPRNKIQATILNFKGRTNFNCAFYDFIPHLTFQIRKVLVTRNSCKNTRCSPLGAMDGWAQDYAHPSCLQYNHHVGDFHN